MDQQPMLTGSGYGYPGSVPQAKSFNASWKIIFFSCGLATMAGAALGLWSMVGELVVSPFDIIIFSYLFLFGLVMVILDSPFQHPRIQEFRFGIYKFCLFLTRFIGRGVTYLFLGSMICANLWDNSTAPLLAFILFAVLCSVGVVAIYYGIRLTKKLESVRKALLNRGGPTATICPPQGLRTDKFGELSLKIQGIPFSPEELGYIANALSQTLHADEVISQREFEFWLKDPTPVLI